ncbi:MAG: PTS sugar transporter subunit IIA [Calditerrivibrio sp.]|nr:PTS sugar transporter subunit IIA [Calditerrivibrio sp.]
MKNIFSDKNSIFEYIGEIEKNEAIMLILKHGYSKGLIKNIEKTSEEIFKREMLGSTGIGDGVAIPHAKLEDIKGVTILFGHFPDGIDYDSADGGRVYYIFLILTEAKETVLHLKTLSNISKLIKGTSFLDNMKGVRGVDSVYSVIHLAWSELK